MAPLFTRAYLSIRKETEEKKSNKCILKHLHHEGKLMFSKGLFSGLNMFSRSVYTSFLWSVCGKYKFQGRTKLKFSNTLLQIILMPSFATHLMVMR